MRHSVELAAAVAIMISAAPVAAMAQPAPSETPAGQTPAGQTPAGRAPAGQAPAGQTPPNAPAQSADPAAAAPQPVDRKQVYYRVGAWQAFSGRGRSGGPVCGVESINPLDSRSLAMRFDIGGEDTVFAASKPDWAIPEGTQVSVVMQVGLGSPWTLRGTGHGQAIDWSLDRTAIQDFDRQFRSAASMTMTFPDGNEPPWTISLAGSTAISNTFGRCVTDLTRQWQNTASPNGNGKSPAPPGATQPFSPSGTAPAH